MRTVTPATIHHERQQAVLKKEFEGKEWWGRPHSNRGPERPKLTMDWPGVRDEFIEWLGSKNYCNEYFKRIIGELDRYIDTITSPLDVARAFRDLTFGQQQNLNRAVRALFNFHEEAMAVED